MSYLYVNENGAKIGIDGNRVVVYLDKGDKRSLPIETLDGVVILGKSQITSQCVEKFLIKGIPVSYFSKGGKYFGRLMSTGHIKAPLQRKQCLLYDTDFSLEFSKTIIKAKIKNQIVVLKRYAKSRKIDILDEEKYMHIGLNKIDYAKNISELMGYEGMAAKKYFHGLSRCIENDFKFKGRNKQPPRDPFNSMISLGYSILMNEIYCEIENKGLNPYFGFMHRDATNHPTLVSDLVEEWRAVIVDSIVMSMINGHEVNKEMFAINDDYEGCFLTKDCLEIFLKKFERKLTTSAKYIYNVDYSVNFRRAISMQIDSLVNAIEQENASIYVPVVIR